MAGRARLVPAVMAACALLGMAAAAVAGTDARSARDIGTLGETPLRVEGGLELPGNPEIWYAFSVERAARVTVSGAGSAVGFDIRTADSVGVQGVLRSTIFSREESASADVEPGSYRLRVRILDDGRADYALTLTAGPAGR